MKRSQSVPGQSLRFLHGGGEMGERIRAYDWASTELGPPQTWPGPLRTMLSMLLGTRHPVFVFWGPLHRCFYNDAYSRSLGSERHPDILGGVGREAWSEIWATIGPQIEQVMSGGGATWHENQLVPITRHGTLQDVYWTYSYTPIDDESAPTGVGGVLVLVTETTAAVLAQQRLEAADARWRMLFEQAPGFICILDGPSHRFEFANPRYQALLGDRRLIGLTVREAVPEVIDQGFIELLDTVYSEGRARTGTAVPLRLRDPADGLLKDRFIDFVYEPLRGEFGVVRGIFVQGSDVTDRVQAHAALAANESRYRALAENLPGGAVFIVDPTLRYVMASGEALAGAGVRGADLIGRTVAEFIGPERAPTYELYYRRALAGETFEVTHEDHSRTYLTRGAPLRDATGAVTGALAASYDITTLRQTEAQLHKAMTKLQGVLASAEVGIWTWDLTTNLVEQDANVVRLYGLPAADLCSVDAHWARIHPGDHETLRKAVETARSTGTFYVREYRVRRDDGGVRWLAGRGLLTRNDVGEPRLLTGLMIDITDLKALEQALRESDRQKDEFLAMLAHELRNPLAPISNAAELLLRFETMDRRAYAAAGVIQRQSRQLGRLVDDLLDISRITQQKIELEREAIPVSDVVAGAIESVQPLLHAKDHDLTIASQDAPLVLGDRVRLVQCLVNVVSNAAKYSDPGGKIRLESFADDDEVVIRVIDHGCGIAPDLLPFVFDLFVQGSRSLDRPQGGLGIGLSLVKRLIELHGGRVSAASPGPGQGSTFELRLPTHHGDVAGETGALTNTVDPLRILVVDDNQDAADSLCELLSLDGHLISAVHSAADGLDAVERLKPHVVLLDIGLPGMDGYQVARRIRAVPALAGVKLIALTGYGQASDKQNALTAGFDDYLVKPVHHEHLLDSLASARNAIDSNHQDRQAQIATRSSPMSHAPHPEQHASDAPDKLIENPLDK